jgi:dihydrofolate synthase/folylpolyglutamate synthase
MPEVGPSPEKDLDAWLSYIDQQHSASIDMGLERFTRVLKDLNLQQPAPVVITVAGTNGKGSTVRVMESLGLEGG